MDLKEIAVSLVKGASEMMAKDLHALPEEAFERNFGGVTRTIPDIIFEINLVNDHVGMVIRGEEPFPWPNGGWITAPADFRGKSAVIDAFCTSTSKIVETVESLTLEQLTETIQLERAPSTRFQRCQFMALHMWYHLGQLNLVQAMLGDNEWHWG